MNNIDMLYELWISPEAWEYIRNWCITEENAKRQLPYETDKCICPTPRLMTEGCKCGGD